MVDNNVEQRVSDVEKRQAVLDAKFDAFIDEMRDFKQEMRQQNEMRAREIMELRRETDKKFERMEAKFDQKFDKIDQKFDKIDEKFDRLESKIDSVNMYAHQMFIAAAIGIGAMILTVVAPLIISSLKTVDEPQIKPQATIQTQVEQTPSEVLLPKD